MICNSNIFISFRLQLISLTVSFCILSFTLYFSLYGMIVFQLMAFYTRRSFNIFSRSCDHILSYLFVLNNTCFNYFYYIFNSVIILLRFIFLVIIRNNGFNGGIFFTNYLILNLYTRFIGCYIITKYRIITQNTKKN